MPVAQLPAYLQVFDRRQAGIEYLAMKIYVYAIKSVNDGRIYVGQSADIEKRVSEHNGGVVRSTKFYKPWKLLYFKECDDRLDARRNEKYLKSGCGKKYLKSLGACSSVG